MPKIGTHYSIASTDSHVYHNYSDCPSGQNILPQSRRSGTGGFPRCGQYRLKD
jgi:hypothetical protein